MNGFGASPPTRFENISVVRAGGHFWGAQTFPGIWVYSATKIFQGIRVSDVDIVDPTYTASCSRPNYVGGQPLFPVADTVFTNVVDLRGPQERRRVRRQVRVRHLGQRDAGRRARARRGAR